MDNYKRSILMLLMICILNSCTNHVEIAEIEIYPYRIEMMGSVDSTVSNLRKKNISMTIEDSHSLPGVQFRYGSLIVDGIEYYLQLYSINNRVEGFDITVSPIKASKKRFFEKLNKELVPIYIKQNMKLKRFVLDTLRDTTSIRPSFTFSVKTKNFDRIWLNTYKR